MRLSLDPKPFGAFIEYTLMPLMEECRDVLDILEKKGIDTKEIMSGAFKLYIVDKIVSLLTNIGVTGIICWTTYLILSNYQA